MNEDQIKEASIKLANQMREVDPLVLANLAKVFGVHQEIFTETLLCYEEATTCNQGFITESTYQMLESATKFMALLRYRESVYNLVERAKTLIIQDLAGTAEEAIALVATSDDKPKTRHKAIAIVEQWMNDSRAGKAITILQNFKLDE